MIQKLLKISKSKLKREMLLFGFEKDDFLTYNNRHLIKENAVAEFVANLIEKWAIKEMRTYSRVIKNLENGL